MAVGIEQRRERERERRRVEILAAAWLVAADVGWASFSVERVAAKAELGRATVYGYFESLEALVLAMAEDALKEFSLLLGKAPGISEALDVPVRFSQKRPAAFALLFPPTLDPRPAFSNDAIVGVRKKAADLVGRIQSLLSRSSASLPADQASAAAFVAGISMAGAFVPELRSSTPLRRRWQGFCLGEDGEEAAPAERDGGNDGDGEN